MMKSTFLFCIAIILIVSFSTIAIGASVPDWNARIDHCLKFAESQLAKTVESLPDSTRYPNMTDRKGVWITNNRYHWTSGFFTGCLWQMYEYTGDNLWKNRAMKWTAPLGEMKDAARDHDIGFQIFLSYGNGYRLTRNEEYKKVVMKAAESLAKRFDPKVGLMMSWNPNEPWNLHKNWKFPVIVDNLMNLELLFWAAQNGGNPEWLTIAETHTLNTAKYHVRDDGSVYHVIDFDPETGAIRKKDTHQGYSVESAWARGNAWGIYGFTMAYRYTKNPVFLETAEKIANFFISNLPDNFIPYWDFRAPEIPDEPRDSSAAAIVASALLELETYTKDLSAQTRYHTTALSILESLSSPDFLAEGTPSSGLLLHGVWHKPINGGIDVSLIYGDCYFLEALLRLKKMLGQ